MAEMAPQSCLRFGQGENDSQGLLLTMFKQEMAQNKARYEGERRTVRRAALVAIPLMFAAVVIALWLLLRS
jgi:hypothetical protein